LPSSGGIETMRRILRSFDAFVRHAAGVFEFTQDPDCILRLQHSTLRHDLVLPDAHFERGTPVLEFHLWNERVPPIPPGGPDFAWARGISRRLIRSFQMVRTHLPTEPARTSPRAVGGVTILGAASGTTSDVLAHLGFHPLPYPNPLGRFGEWWENAYTWSLMWAYNPASLRGKQLGRLRRAEYWMSTSAFLDRFTAP
jgi:hypothetical protein